MMTTTERQEESPNLAGYCRDERGDKTTLGKPMTAGPGLNTLQFCSPSRPLDPSNPRPRAAGLSALRGFGGTQYNREAIPRAETFIFLQWQAYSVHRPASRRSEHTTYLRWVREYVGRGLGGIGECPPIDGLGKKRRCKSRINSLGRWIILY